jgi:type II secretory pathway component PulK
MNLTSWIYFRRQGSVLILVLIVISAMTVMAFGAAYQTRIEIKLSKSSSQQIQAWYLAISGLEACKAILAKKELTPAQTTGVCRFYEAKDIHKLFDQSKMMSDQNNRIACWIQDENSFLDLNFSDSASWERLPAFTRDKRACILDWIDPDSDTNPDSAETDYYEGQEHPYKCKNKSFICLKELLFVKNITRNDYLGDILNNAVTEPDDIKTVFNENLAQKTPFINTFTVYGRGKVNINTVPRQILSALPGLDQRTAEIICSFRAGPDGMEKTEDDIIIDNSDGISKIEGLTDLQKELLTQYCCFNSNVFKIYSYAKINRQRCFLMATIKVMDNKPNIISIERLL